MNSRQRRGVILLILSVLCALGAFAGVLSVINDVKSKVGPEVTAYRLRSDVAPYTSLDASQFESDRGSDSVKSQLATIDSQADRAGVRGTPTIYVVHKGGKPQLVTLSSSGDPSALETAINTAG